MNTGELVAVFERIMFEVGEVVPVRVDGDHTPFFDVLLKELPGLPATRVRLQVMATDAIPPMPYTIEEYVQAGVANATGRSAAGTGS